jgi:hypothetical protein
MLGDCDIDDDFVVVLVFIPREPLCRTAKTSSSLIVEMDKNLS